MLELLSAVTRQGTGRGAALAVPTFGKTGTSQDSRDAYFIGFAGDLVTGVWIGHDNNRPVGEVTGGGIPAQIWRGFMGEAVKNVPAAALPEVATSEEDLPPLANGTLPLENYDVQDYDVEGAAVVPVDPGLAAEGDLSPPAEAFPEDGEPPLIDPGTVAPAPPVEITPRAREASPSEDAPAPRRREIPTIAPPPPPAPRDDAPAEDDDPAPKSDGPGA
jgi:penicillin-binding protein 1A